MFHQTFVVTNSDATFILRRMPIETTSYEGRVAGSSPAGSIFDGAVAQR